jgi:hypothetical protein
MSGGPVLDVKLNRASQVYFPGETVSGAVMVSLYSFLPAICCLLSLACMVAVTWICFLSYVTYFLR